MSGRMPVRSTKTLSETMNHRLPVYSLAAVSDGVGMLTLAQPAEGKVVITHTNISLSDFKSAAIDLNKDGINDFVFAVSAGGCGSWTETILYAIDVLQLAEAPYSGVVFNNSGHLWHSNR